MTESIASIRLPFKFAPALMLLFLAVASVSVRAQSTELESPTPVTSTELQGQISALDIGDSRLTRHFYIFTGTRGDLTLTVTSTNLNGDIDVFAQKTLRPLVKIGLYSTESGSITTKSVFLHDREPLILRVEARSPNDDPGQYKISFSGGFEAMQGPGNQAPEPTASQARTPGTRRVTSVGASIEEPKPPEAPKPAESEVAAQPTPSPTPTPEATPSTNASEEAAAKPTPTPQKRAPARRKPGTGRTASSARSPRSKPAAEAESKPTTEASAQPSESTPTTPAPKPKQDIPAPPTAKIIVELKDGTRVEHSMSTVRRVLIDNGQIVIINNNGKIERLPMANVLRMAIEP